MKVFPIENNRGGVLIITAICLVLIIGVIGLAVDSGMGYGVKAKLNAAVDAAAIAAARAAVEGDTPAQQRVNGKDAAEKFFHANFPADYLRATPTLRRDDVGISIDGGTITVDVTATAVMPTLFMGVMGNDSLNVRAESQVVRRDLDLSFVFDVTGSLSGVEAEVKVAAAQFINRFNENMDRIAFITFAYGAEVEVPIRTGPRGFDKAGVQAAISGSSMSGLTNFSEGFWAGWQELDGIPEANRSTVRAILFFTDGAPNTFASTFVYNSGESYAGSARSGDSSGGTARGLWRHDRLRSRMNPPGWISFESNVPAMPTFYNPHDPAENEFRVVTNLPRQVTSEVNYDNVNRAARNLPEAMAEEARKEGIFVFTLGLGDYLTEPTGPDDEYGEDILKRMANDDRMQAPVPSGWERVSGEYKPDQPAGLYCHAADTDQLDLCYGRLASVILRLTR